MMKNQANNRAESAEFEATIVVESYNLSEGGDLDRLRHVLQSATQMAQQNGNARVFITDVEGAKELLDLIASEFPDVERVEALGMSYDEAKAKAAQQAKSRFVLYLDGDCLPQDGWLDWRRLQNGRRDLGLKPWQVTPALALYPFLRLIDFAGMLSALTKPCPASEASEASCDVTA